VYDRYSYPETSVAFPAGEPSENTLSSTSENSSFSDKNDPSKMEISTSEFSTSSGEKSPKGIAETSVKMIVQYNNIIEFLFTLLVICNREEYQKGFHFYLENHHLQALQSPFYAIPQPLS